MAERRRTRVHGPYHHRGRWRILVRAPEPNGDWTTDYRSFESEAAAQEAKECAELALAASDAWERVAKLEADLEQAREQAAAAGAESLTVGELIARYEDWITERGRKPESISTMIGMLHGMLGSVLDAPARSITPARAEEFYRARAEHVAAATHRGELGQCRRTWRWAADRKLVTRADTWAAVEPRGRVSEGKEQLRPGEAQRWYETALAVARGGGAGKRAQARARGALAAICTLILGYRAGEVTALRPRDVEGGLAWLAKGKSRASRRHVEIPGELQQLLEAHAARMLASGQDRLFPHTQNWLWRHVGRLCELAGVPRVCPHSMRGLHGTLATDAGVTAVEVARQLGHARTAITERHYIDPAARASAGAARVLRVIEGGKQSGRETFPAAAVAPIGRKSAKKSG